MNLFHGAHTSFALHAGQCFTDDDKSAEAYAQSGVVAEVEISFTGLNVQHVGGYDRDEDDAPADRESDRAALEAAGVDVLVFDDEDEMGRAHTTWRLISSRAVGAAQVLSINPVD